MIHHCGFRKARLITNMLALRTLGNECFHDHSDFVCLRSVRTAEGRVSVVQAAGRYPFALSRRWAAAVADGLVAVADAIVCVALVADVPGSRYPPSLQIQMCPPLKFNLAK